MYRITTLQSRGVRLIDVLGATQISGAQYLFAAVGSLHSSITLQELGARVRHTFSHVPEDGLIELNALLDLDSVRDASEEEIERDDWKIMTKIIQKVCRAESGVHFVYHDIRSNPKKFAHCSRYLCAARASNRQSEQKRRRNNPQVIKFHCRGTFNCFFKEGWDEVVVSIVHIDHNVIGVAKVLPLKGEEDDPTSPEDLPASVTTAQNGVKASPSALAEEPARKRARREDSPSVAVYARPQARVASYSSNYLESPPLAEAQQNGMSNVYYTPPSLIHAMPAISPHAQVLVPVAMPVMQSTLLGNTYQPTMHIAPAPALLERPLSSMSGFAAQADYAQDAEELLPAALDIIRKGRGLQPYLDELLSCARRLLQAAQEQEESNRQAMTRHLQEATVAAVASPPAPPSSVLHQAPFADEEALQLDASLGDLNLGLSMDSWRMLRLMN